MEKINLNYQKSNLKKFEKKFVLFCIYLGDKIDLKALQENLKKYPYLSREQPLILKLASGQYAVVTKFGTVTFWNVSTTLREEFIKEIEPFVENFNRNHSNFDTLKIWTGKEIEDVRFGKVYLNKIDREKIQIISLVLSQSVALEKYEKEVEKMVLEMEKIITVLKAGFWKGLKEEKLTRQIGEILSLKQNTISHLSLFDKPEITWEKIEIEKLYNKLYFEFELADRFDILNEKIKFLSEHHKLLLDFILAKRGNFLELVIIILIFVEIIIFFIEMFLFSR